MSGAAIDRIYMLVPVEHVATADALAASTDPDDGSKTFSEGAQLGATAAGPVTHRGAASWVTDPATITAAQAAALAYPWFKYQLESEFGTWAGLLFENSLVEVTPE